MKIAYGAARYGLGDSLLTAARRSSPQDLVQFLVGWREELKTALGLDRRGLIGRKCKRLASKITLDFPNVETPLMYAKPVTTWSLGGGGNTSISAAVSHQLNLPRCSACSTLTGPQKRFTSTLRCCSGRVCACKC